MEKLLQSRPSLRPVRSSPLSSEIIEIVAFDCDESCPARSPLKVLSQDAGHSSTCKTSFFAHKDLLCTYSDVIERQLNGQMKEAVERKIELPDSGRDVVECFLEFIYTGRYQPPQPEKRNSSTQSTEGKSESEPAQVISGLFSAKPFPTPVTEQSSVFSFAGMVGLISTDLCQGPANWPIKKPPNALKAAGAQQDFQPNNLSLFSSKLSMKEWKFEPPLRAGARTYAFANKYNIASLQQLAFMSIRNILVFSCKGTLPQATIDEDIVPLISYVYNNTYSPNRKEEEPLRKLVSNFTAWKIKSLEGPAWEQLLEEGGDFAVDFMMKVRQRMIAKQADDEGELKQFTTPSSGGLFGKSSVSGGIPGSSMASTSRPTGSASAASTTTQQTGTSSTSNASRSTTSAANRFMF